MAHEGDELIAVLRLERLQHVAEVGFVQVADEAAERLAVMSLDRGGDLLDEIGVEDPLLVADLLLGVGIRLRWKICFHRGPSARRARPV